MCDVHSQIQCTTGRAAMQANILLAVFFIPIFRRI
nr:MAG TPA: hypothetical protein [Caudoviricetes sp.]